MESHKIFPVSLLKRYVIGNVPLSRGKCPESKRFRNTCCSDDLIWMSDVVFVARLRDSLDNALCKRILWGIVTVSRTEQRMGRIENICRGVLAAWGMRFALKCRKKKKLQQLGKRWRTRVIPPNTGIVDSQLALVIHLRFIAQNMSHW